MFGVKDPVPCGLCAGVVYKFSCADGIACYVGKITWHFSPGVLEQRFSDRVSHIFKHATYKILSNAEPHSLMIVSVS